MTPNDTFASPRATVFVHDSPQIRVQNRSLAPSEIGKHLFICSGAVDNVARVERIPVRSDLFSPQNAEAQTTQPGMKLQNGRCSRSRSAAR